jgi:cytochrome c biogenesis protein CcdA
MLSVFSTLGFGLILGIKHAFDADHLIAVSTMLYEQKSPKKAALIGAFWGIGHTTTLFVVGLIVLLLRLSIPEMIAERIEIIVGFMLIFLGIRTMLSKNTLHEHEHAHDDQQHTHIHDTHNHQHKKSFLIGTIHGLAGSGALMILVLSLIKTVWEGVIYILIFGIGSTLGMTMMSFFLGIPIAKTFQTFAKTERILRIIMGSVSIIFGLVIIVEMFSLK